MCRVASFSPTKNKTTKQSDCGNRSGTDKRNLYNTQTRSMKYLKPSQLENGRSVAVLHELADHVIPVASGGISKRHLCCIETNRVEFDNRRCAFKLGLTPLCFLSFSLGWGGGGSVPRSLTTSMYATVLRMVPRSVSTIKMHPQQLGLFTRHVLALHTEKIVFGCVLVRLRSYYAACRPKPRIRFAGGTLAPPLRTLALALLGLGTDVEACDCESAATPFPAGFVILA